MTAHDGHTIQRKRSCHKLQYLSGKNSYDANLTSFAAHLRHSQYNTNKAAVICKSFN